MPCSSALLGYGLESLVDVWSSILVLWRFWDDPEGEGSYFVTTQRRESRASVGIAFTFVVIGYITCWQVRCGLASAAASCVCMKGVAGEAVCDALSSASLPACASMHAASHVGFCSACWLICGAMTNVAALTTEMHAGNSAHGGAEGPR